LYYTETWNIVNQTLYAEKRHNHLVEILEMIEHRVGFYNIILGLVLLTFGRRLFWISVAVAGFLLGMEFAGLMLPDRPLWMQLLIALGAGFLGAVLAVLFQRVAFALAGFYGGAYIALISAQALGLAGSTIILFFAGGVVGAVFAILVMDWAIILLSCLVGAGAIVEVLGLGQNISIIVFLALVLIGAFAQSKFLPKTEGR
jgi:hypothetical protein